MKSLIEFDHKKATQVLNYFATKEGGKIDKLKVIKLVWLADRYHLRKYGRPIVNDVYMAMPYGPVPSSVKDIAELSDFMAEEEKEYTKEYLDAAKNLVLSTAPVDTDVFSKTDLEALDTIYENYGSMKNFDLVKFAHEFPEWKKHQEILKISTREPMAYTDFFKNPEIKIQGNIFNESPEHLQDVEDIYQQNYKIANFWVS